MGAHAVLALLESTKDSETKVICIKSNKVIKLSLMECVKNTLEIEKAINENNYNKALELRGPYVMLLHDHLFTYHGLSMKKRNLFLFFYNFLNRLVILRKLITASGWPEK